MKDAVSKISPTSSAVQGAGRTDAGVHALQQVAHVDILRTNRRTGDAVCYNL